MAQRCGIGHFSVASATEAEEVRQASGPECTVMIMSVLPDADLEWAIEQGIEFYAFDLARLEHAAEVAQRVGRPARIHLEIETGGNRTGLPLAHLPAALKLLKQHGDRLRFVGFCTHLAGAETLATRFRIEKQLTRFKESLKALKHRPRPELLHVASSAAALTMPEDTAYDLVRAGVASYGFFPSPDVYNLHLMRVNKTRDNPLKRVLSWKTELLHVKDVARDEFIGYGTSFQAERDMRIGIIPLGYANGYPREMSNKGHVLVRGFKARIVGLVNMNLFMVDLTQIPQAAQGDQVVLVGRQRNNVISVSSFSEFSNALNTEFVCRLPARIPRVVVR
jgi:alanine racemase